MPALLDPDQLEATGQDPEPPPTAPPPGGLPPDVSALLTRMLAGQQVQTGQSVSASQSIPTEMATPEEKAVARGRTDAAIGRAAFTTKVDPEAAAQRSAATGDSIMNRYRENMKAPLAEVQTITDEQLKPLQDEARRTQEEYDKAVKSRETYRTRVQTAMDDMDQFAKRIAAEQPHDIWAEQGLGTRLIGIALQGVGAAAQSFYGDKTNAITDAIEAKIKRDLAIQKLRMDKGKDDYANKNLLLNQLSGNFDRIEHAEDAAYLTAWHGIIGRLNVVKTMLTDPQMRANMEKTIAEGQMKTAQASERLQTNLVGTDVRMKQGVAKLELDAEKARTGANGAAMLNASTRAEAEKRLQGKNTREEHALEIPNWEFASGFKGSPKEATDLREMEEDTTKATTSLDQVATLLEQGGQYTSYPKWQDIKAAANRAVVKLKGKGLVNAGANFTALEEQLIKSGYLSSTGEWQRNLDPGAVKRIRDAEADLWDDVMAAMKERGGTPSKSHPVFGG